MKRLFFAAAALCCLSTPVQAQTAGASRAYELSEVDSMPRPTNVQAFQSALQAAYPPALLQAGKGGRVLLSLVVAADGSTGQTRVIESSDSAFDGASLSSIAVLRWAPGSRGGRPVATRVEIPIEWEAPLPAGGVAAADVAKEGDGVDEDGVYELSAVAVQPQLLNTDYLTNTLRRLYPRNAENQCLSPSARVDVRFRLGADGLPTNVRILRSSDSRFNEPSRRAVAGARFRPAQVGGYNVPTWLVLPLQWEC